MDIPAFQAFVTDNPAIDEALHQAAQAVPAKGFTLVTEAAALALLFPVASFILKEIGLPWLATLKKYSDVERRRVEDWIDRHAESHGLNPDEVEAASKALMKALERTTETKAQKQWERLTQLLKK